MVKQVEEFDDYYHQEDDDDPWNLFFAPDYLDTDEQLVVIAVLILLEQRYRVMASMTPSRLLDELDEIIDSLESELHTTASDKVQEYTQKFLDRTLIDYGIPLGYLDIDTSMIDIMRDGITGLCNNLRDELRVKSKFFKDNLSKDTFNILPNFKRAVKKLIDSVGSNLIFSKEKTDRRVKEFIYGEDKLYRWITANDDKVCEWCRIQESMPPRLLSEIPLDHPWGRCILEPIDNSFSSEYYLVLARRSMSEGIDIFSENKWDY